MRRIVIFELHIYYIHKLTANDTKNITLFNKEKQIIMAALLHYTLQH